MRKLTKRYIIPSLEGLNLSKPIKYERYYINDTLRIQNKDNIYQKEILDKNNNIIEKKEISEKEYLTLKEKANSKIIRNSYLFLEDKRISIKEYLGKYSGLLRAEVTFNSKEEEKTYRKESWMGKEITSSPLAFDKYLCKLSEKEFKEELNKYIKLDNIIKPILIKNKFLFGTNPKVEKINIGFTNTLYNINNLYIVKVCTNPKNEENFKREIEFYNLNKFGKITPKLYYSDINKKDIPYIYEILEKINGISLYNVWHTLSEKEREDIISKLCNIMKQIHNVKGKPYDWSKYMKDKFIPLYDKVKELFNDKEQELIKKAYSNFDKYLESDEFVLVHNDLHFDNIFFDNGNIKIIDFERWVYAPKDFELDIIYRMIRKPWKFASEEIEKYTNKNDYSNIMKYIEKYYNEIIETPNLYKRLAIYDMIYYIKQLLEYPHLDELKEDILNAAKYLL